MFQFLVLVLIVIGPYVVIDQQQKGNLPDTVEECPSGIVRSPSGTEYRRYVDFDGTCSYSMVIR